MWIAITGLLAGAIWLLPGRKPEAVFGRYNFTETACALIATAIFVTLVVIACGGERRRRIWEMRALALWLSTCFTIVGCELIAVFVLPPSNPFYTFNQGGVASDSSVPFELPYTRPPHLTWEGWSRGNIPRWGPDPKDTRWLSFETDHEGFRNREDLEFADLVFIGDSFTEGGNVAYEECFVQLTADALNCTARNLGLFGYPPQAEFAVLKHYGLKCEPKVVIWQIFEGNDIADSIHFEDKMRKWNELGQPRFDRSHPPHIYSLWVQRSPIYYLFSRLVSRERDWFAGEFTLRSGEVRTVRFMRAIAEESHFAVDAFGNEHPGWTPIAADISECSHLLRQRNVQLVVLFIPMKSSVLADAVVFDEWSRPRLPRRLRVPASQSIATALKRLCERDEIPFVDATPYLEAATAERELSYIPSDTHLSAYGNQVISRALVENLQALLDRKAPHELESEGLSESPR